MKRQEVFKQKSDMTFDREKKIKNPAKAKRKQHRKVYHEDEYDDFDLEIASLKKQDSLEDYFDDDED
ncbi:MAG: hypothetical protein PF489_09910 [Salinivirgaceae bacterium]|jgi:hypothetical protein|nr:hypothetical protein [Salinivirgaceae bacterium]